MDVIEARQRGTSVEVGGGVVAHLTNNVGLWAPADYTTDVAGERARDRARQPRLRWVW